MPLNEILVAPVMPHYITHNRNPSYIHTVRVFWNNHSNPMFILSTLFLFFRWSRLDRHSTQKSLRFVNSLPFSTEVSNGRNLIGEIDSYGWCCREFGKIGGEVLLFVKPKKSWNDTSKKLLPRRDRLSNLERFYLVSEKPSDCCESWITWFVDLSHTCFLKSSIIASPPKLSARL